MQPFILWQKVEPPYIYGILSNFKKVQIGYLDSYGNKVYFASYYDYDDISEDYEPEQEPNGKNISGDQWNRYQQRKYYKNLRENLNNSSNPEYSRPQHLPNDILFAPIHQHNHNLAQFPNDKITHFQNNLKNNSRKVVGGAGDLLNALQKYQKQFPINRTGFNSVMFDKNAISHESVSYGYSNFTDEAPPPTNYRNLIRTGGRGVPGGLKSNLNDEIILKTIIVDEAGNELPFGTIINQEEIFHSEKKWDRREAIRYNSDLWYLRESLKKGYIRSGDTEILKEFVIDPNKNEKQKNRATITVIYEENGGYWKGSGTYNLVYIDEDSHTIEEIVANFNNTIDITFIRGEDNIDYSLSSANDVDNELRIIANILNGNPNLTFTIFGDTRQADNSKVRMNIYGRNIKLPVSFLMKARAKRIRQILIRDYGVNPDQINTRVGLYGQPTFRIRGEFDN